MNTDKVVAISLAFLMVFLGLVFILFPEETVWYHRGVKDTYKEAYEKGFMVKEITKDDQVIYRWKSNETN
jgi:hypothetical protein